jgi:glycosyltransferase involved in cell wall biosynthesis
MDPLTAAQPRILYVVYWGAAEPLGRSLVLPAVKNLARGTRLTLVTFEKPVDLRDTAAMAEIRETLSGCGVRWIYLQYHKRPRVPATAFDIVHGVARGVVANLGGRFDIVHARTFIGGLVGTLLAPVLGAKLIYHNEGFYPDEMVDGGFFALNSPMHRTMRWLEAVMYARADGLVTLSHRARQVVQELPAVARRRTPVIVVPSCVDLDRFGWTAPHRDEGEPLRFVYIGAVGGRYGLDRAARFVAVVARRRPVRLRVLTRAEPTLVENMITAGGLPQDVWSQAMLPHEAMPAELRQHEVGLFFLTQGLSEHGCSPTKIGEYWASGLPVVTTPNVSDTDEIIRRQATGVVLAGDRDEDYGRATDALLELLEDGELGARCRRAAEEHYALLPACERQLDLYRQLAAPRVLATAATSEDRR